MSFAWTLRFTFSCVRHSACSGECDEQEEGAETDAHPSATPSRFPFRCPQKVRASRADHRLAFILRRNSDLATAFRAVDQLGYPERHIGSPGLEDDTTRG